MYIVKSGLKVAGLFLCTVMWSNTETSVQANGFGVARISLCDDGVTIRRGNSSDWLEGSINTPLVQGDTLATWRSARTEIQLDSRNIFRLGEDSRILFSELSDKQFSLTLEHGTLTYNKLSDDRVNVHIETPFVIVQPTTHGMLRIEVGFDGKTVITTRRGKANIIAEMETATLHQGETMTVWVVSNDEIKSELTATPPKDTWDHWNEKREKRLRTSHSRQHVSQDIYGVEDLDRYGNWRYVAGYGYSWYPNVNINWSPYRHGRWVWLDHYGWSWVGYESWGWAPYHYGRWHYHKHRGWGWNPGRIYRRHYWRPALVAFFGHNRSGSFSANFGFGSIGWVPLAPREPYYAWYGSRLNHRSDRHRRHRNYARNGRTNRTIVINNSTNIYDVYRNSRARNGVTMVDVQHFARGQVRNARSPHHEELRRTRLLRGRIPVTPEYGSRGQRVRLVDSHTDANRRWKTHQKPHTGSHTKRESVRGTTLPIEQQRPQAVRPSHTRRSVRSSARPPGNVQRANTLTSTNQRHLNNVRPRPSRRLSTRQQSPRSQSSRMPHRVSRDNRPQAVRPSYTRRSVRSSARPPGNVQRANRSREQRRR
jgi:hypothetical protein